MKGIQHGRSIVFAYLGVALPALVGLALYPKLIHNLGPDRFGALSVVLSIAFFLSNFDFGVGLAITRFIARFKGRQGGSSGIRRLVGNAVYLQFCVGVMTGSLLLSFHFIWGLVRTDINTTLHDEFNVAIFWLSISIPVALIAGVVRNGFEGIGRFGVANALRAFASIGVFAVPVVLSFFTNRIDNLTLSLLITRIVTAAIFVLVWLRISPQPIQYPARILNFWRHSRILLSYGGWVMVGVASGGLIVTGLLDRVLIARFMDIGEVVKYSVPNDVIVRALLIPGAITSVILSVLARMFVEHPAEVSNLHRQATSLMAGQVGPIVVLLLINSNLVLETLTGIPDSKDAAFILQGMATGYFIHALAHIPYSVLHAAGAPKAAGVRHLFQLPVYAAISSVLLLNEHIRWIGWLWCVWAVIDLFMLIVLVKRITTNQVILPTLVNPTILTWGTLIIFSNFVAAFKLGELTSYAVSILAAALFVFRLTKILMSDIVLRQPNK